MSQFPITIDEFEINLFETERTREFSTLMTPPGLGNVYINPPGVVMNMEFVDAFPDILNFEVYPDDVWVISYPKCGQTWTQEMVWLLANNADFDTAKSTLLEDRYMFLEVKSLDKDYKWSKVENVKLMRPRFIKTHLPLQLLPRKLHTVKPKIIYVTRDPRDTIVSFHHFLKLWGDYSGSLQQTVDLFLSDEIVYSPFWTHVLDFWNIRDEPNIHFITYEQMKQDLDGVIRKTADFLCVDLNDAVVSAMVNHLSFNKMKDNKSVNYKGTLDVLRESKGLEPADAQGLRFMRSGESGGWKNELSPELIEKFEDWFTKHLEHTPFKTCPWLQNS